MRSILLVLAAGLAGCSALQDRTLVNAGSEAIRLQLLERGEGYPDYRSPVGPALGLAPGESCAIYIDTGFENVIVVASGDRVVGEVPLPADGPEVVPIDASKLGPP